MRSNASFHSTFFVFTLTSAAACQAQAFVHSKRRRSKTALVATGPIAVASDCFVYLHRTILISHIRIYHLRMLLKLSKTK